MSTSTTSGGSSFAGLLFIAFLVLKLTHYIAWSWLWVTAPLWGGIVLGAFFFLFALAVLFVKEAIAMRRSRRRRAS